jgi:uncharacterized SAM-binding protein YcdF (DUF218 family)
VIWLLSSLVLFILLAWILLALGLDRYGQQPIPGGPFDAIIVPGCKVLASGQPSAALSRRVRHAVDLWCEGRAPVIVLTGGIGTHPPSEAAAAAELARSLGVPSGALLLEELSVNTRDNAALASRLQYKGQEISGWRVLVLTDAYHAWRCSRLFGRYFEQAIGRGSRPGWRLRIRGSLREVLSIGLGTLRR